MKKILSILLVSVMLISTLVIFALPMSAAKGEWSVYTTKEQYLDDYVGVMHDIPGYEYTDEGLKMIPAEWADSSPWGTVQTSDKVNLQDGVYLQVRVDEFTYTAGDKWFAFSFWDQQNPSHMSVSDEHGYGCETLIRISNGSAEVVDDLSTWAGGATRLEWFTDVEENARIKCTDNIDTLFKMYKNKFDDQKRPIITIEVQWDDTKEQLAVSVNGSPAPETYNKALTEYFAEDNYMAYVGFAMQNSEVGGTVGCTVLKFGTSSDDATAPVGDDKQAPKAFLNTTVPIEDASSVPAGEPAIRLTGSNLDSHVAGKPASVFGNRVVVNDDGSVNVTGNASNLSSSTYIVENSYSYDIVDFPIALIIVRNLCTCTYGDIDFDGVLDEMCVCNEKINTYIRAGAVIADENNLFRTTAVEDLEAPCKDADGNNYIYFIVDYSDLTSEEMTDRLEGRINGIRIDTFSQTLKGNDPDRNNYDVCEVDFCRSREEAVACFNAFMEKVGGTGVETPEDTDTEEPSETPSETPSEDPTEAPTDNSDDKESEAPTKAPDKTETEASTNADSGNKSDDDNGGCGSIVGVGALFVAVIAGMGLVSFRKKKY